MELQWPDLEMDGKIVTLALKKTSCTSRNIGPNK